RVVLSVAKSKGYRLKDVVMRLAPDSRWFTPTKEAPPTLTCLEEIVKFVNHTGRTKTREIHGAFTVRYSKRTIEDALSDAARKELLRRPRRGIWEPLLTTEPALPYDECGNVGAEFENAVVGKTVDG